MSIKNLYYSFIILALLAFAGTATAQGPQAGSGPATSELTMTAEVVTAVQLNISTGTAGATLTGDNATGLFDLDFGDLNALGTGNTQNVNVTVAVDGTGATYTTPINLTPIFTGFTIETAAVTVEAGVGADQILAREGAAAGTAVAVTTPVAAFAGAASGSANERVVGFRVLRTKAAGPLTATLIYSITIL